MLNCLFVGVVVGALVLLLFLQHVQLSLCGIGSMQSEYVPHCFTTACKVVLIPIEYYYG